MGADPYEYFVGYDEDVQSALDKLRADVFQSGDFHGSDFGAQTPEEALELTDAEGTASILDIQRVTAKPDFCCAAPFDDDELQEYFGTDTPTRDDIETGMFWDDLERGHARYVVVYEQDQPSELYFAGYSFD